MISYWLVRCYRSEPLWRGQGGDATCRGYLPRSRAPDALTARPEPSSRFTSLPDALDAGRQWLSYWTDMDDYNGHAQVIDAAYELVHEFESFPVRVPVTTRTLFNQLNIDPVDRTPEQSVDHVH